MAGYWVITGKVCGTSAQPKPCLSTSPGAIPGVFFAQTVIPGQTHPFAVIAGVARLGGEEGVSGVVGRVGGLGAIARVYGGLRGIVSLGQS